MIGGLCRLLLVLVALSLPRQTFMIVPRLCRESPGALQHVMTLATAQQPAVQHFALKLLLSWIQPKARHEFPSEWLALKVWLIQTFGADWEPVPVFVRGKFADVVVAVAKVEWPNAWPELSQALLGGRPSLGSSLLHLAIWTRLAECLGEDSKDLTAVRRRDIAQGIGKQFQEPPEAICCSLP